MEKNLTLNEYQYKAMSTCMDTCDNLAYMLSGLTAEVGEINDKVAKAVRKGKISLHRNNLSFWIDGESAEEFQLELAKEIGDALWFLAGLSKVIGYKLGEIGDINIEKLQSRKKRGVIDGNGDNR